MWQLAFLGEKWPKFPTQTIPTGVKYAKYSNNTSIIQADIFHLQRQSFVAGWPLTMKAREDVAQVRWVQWLLEVVLQLGWKPGQQCVWHYTTTVSVWCLAHLWCKHNMKTGCMTTLPEATAGCPCQSCGSQYCWTDTQWSPALKTQPSQCHTLPKQSKNTT